MENRGNITLIGMYLVTVLCLLIVTAVCVLYCCSGEVVPSAVKSDTVIVRDTVRDTVPKPVKSDFVGAIKERPVLLTDTIKLTDTLYVDSSGLINIPITRKEYTDDSTYRAVVSGYKAKLDEIDVYRKTVYITNTVTKQKRWNIGLTGGAGYGLTTHKPDIFVGIGISFTIPP